MSSLALLLSAGTTAATADLPYFHLGALDIGIPIQWFGMIVAVGVMVGATPLRRYAEWHGVSDDNIRGLLTWVMISGFLGAHEFDVLAYQWDKLGDANIVTPAGWWFLPVGLWPSNWPLVFRIWDGISSYGGFIGGAIGFAIFVWWKRLPVRLFADITLVGLLLAFTIGRIGCTVVSDHIGAAVSKDHWYAFLAMDYPSEVVLHHKDRTAPEIITAWNLGLIEFLYLVPVNALVLWLAFRPAGPGRRRMPAGFIAVLIGMLYAPVRFFLDFLRPEDTDPIHLGLTFAQWASILAFGVSLYVGRRILQSGAVAETVAPTSREAQERLRIILRDDDDAARKHEAGQAAQAERKRAAIAQARAERDREDAELAARTAAGAGPAGAATAPAPHDTADEDDGDDSAGEPEAEAAAKPAAAKPAAAKPAAAKPAAAKPAGAKPAAGKSAAKQTGNRNKTKSRKR
jgi:phosphatidylglycerol:prolipoprotein diacylglycerol transferase